jgi:hypothetical protein
MAWVSDAVFSALVLASGVLAASTLGFAVAWVRARERAIRAEQRAGPAPAGDLRVDRLEHAVETIAAEVEQMSEGQRFVGRLLAERLGQERDAGAHPARATTPH